ncbi:MAG: hypothetical protein ABI717_08760 [Actinomycetota bacterium]
MSRRVAVIAGVVVLVAVLLVAVGRWERERHADEEVRGMERVLVAIGPLDNPTLASFRFLTDFQCLGYKREKNPVALEVCFDAAGRVVEAFDRREGEAKIWSLREDPTSSTLRRDRAEVDRLLVRMGVPERLIRDVHERAAN